MQYTKRILPWFVIPECNISLANVLEYIQEYPDGQIDCDRASMILGALDDRTIRKHIRNTWLIIQKANIVLTEIIADSPEYIELPEIKVKQNKLICFKDLISRVNNAYEKKGKLGRMPEIACVHQVYYFEKAREPLKTALNHVLWNLHYFDTG